MPFLGHPGGKVTANFAQHDDDRPGHVFATVIAHALHYGGAAGVAHGKTLSRATTGKEFSTGCAVEDGVPGDNIFPGDETAL